MNRTFDFAVIGAGVFGAWTAWQLRRSGASVALLDSYGPASSRASSGGETRVIRMGYGPDELYSRWAMRSLPQWLEFGERAGMQVFHRTGVLWLSNEKDAYTHQMWSVLSRCGVTCERLDAADIRRRFPQLRMADVTWGVLEPESGLLMARRAVQELVRECVRNGVEYRQSLVAAPRPAAWLERLETSSGDHISAGTFIFACGPWLPRMFPDVLSGRIFPTRQEVFFLGTPPGKDAYRPPRMPVWLHHTHPELPYSLPEMENRGFKIAFDRHGVEFDPDSDSRTVPQSSIETLRDYLREHVPELAQAPVVETRVCQYENTSNGDFLLDHHPEMDNVWFAGGGSGHGFKHGPAVGEYLSSRLLQGSPAEPRFSLESKLTVHRREVY